jgi:hypothetical protein
MFSMWSFSFGCTQFDVPRRALSPLGTRSNLTETHHLRYDTTPKHAPNKTKSLARPLNGKPQTSRDRLSSWNACFIGIPPSQTSARMASHKPREIGSPLGMLVSLDSVEYSVLRWTFLSMATHKPREGSAVRLECLLHWNPTIRWTKYTTPMKQAFQ